MPIFCAMLRATFRITVRALFCAHLLYTQLCAQPLRVAVAASVQSAAALLAERFKRDAGVEVVLISGSSGKLAAQIENGAPFDVFLSADTVYPARLHRAGFAESPRLYAQGTLVLWTTSTRLLSGAFSDSLSFLLDFLLDDSIKHIAVANPDVAPYGTEAIRVLKRLGLYERLQPKLVFGESVAQASHFVATGAAEVGFTSLSVVMSNQMSGSVRGTWRVVTEAAPIPHAATVLTRSSHSASRRFFEFLFSPAAQDIFTRYGYRYGSRGAEVK